VINQSVKKKPAPKENLEVDEAEHHSDAQPDPELQSKSEPKSKQVFVLIYCCPPRSPPKLRMVYSTAIGSLVAQIQAMNLPLEFKIELFDDLPSSQATLKYLYLRAIDCIADDGVHRLTTTPQLAKLVQNSHQKHTTDTAADMYASNIRPRGSQARPPHPVFGHALPALASSNSKTTQ